MIAPGQDNPIVGLQEHVFVVDASRSAEGARELDGLHTLLALQGLDAAFDNSVGDAVRFTAVDGEHVTVIGDPAGLRLLRDAHHILCERYPLYEVRTLAPGSPAQLALRHENQASIARAERTLRRVRNDLRWEFRVRAERGFLVPVPFREEPLVAFNAATTADEIHAWEQSVRGSLRMTRADAHRVSERLAHAVEVSAEVQRLAAAMYARIDGPQPRPAPRELLRAAARLAVLETAQAPDGVPEGGVHGPRAAALRLERGLEHLSDLRQDLDVSQGASWTWSGYDILRRFVLPASGEGTQTHAAELRGVPAWTRTGHTEDVNVIEHTVTLDLREVERLALAFPESGKIDDEHVTYVHHRAVQRFALLAVAVVAYSAAPAAAPAPDPLAL